MDIKNQKEKLNDAIMVNDLKTALEVSKDLGLSMRFICKKANVNVGNLSRFVGGKLPMFNIDKINSIYDVMREVLLNG